MCLFDATEIKLEKDLTVYKVLTVINGKLCSPYYTDFNWEIDKTYEIKKDKPDIRHNTVPSRFYPLKTIKYIEIEGDAFHTFRTIDDAKIFCENCSGVLFNDFRLVIYECVIPKSSKFVYTDRVGLQYASEKLKLVKEITF